LHQKKQGEVLVSSLSARASSGEVRMYIDLVRRYLQGVAFMASAIELEKRAADQGVGERQFVGVELKGFSVRKE
jgi:hypothetical protein